MLILKGMLGGSHICVQLFQTQCFIPGPHG
eukprot:SAG22_NODE_10450_length_535_cov_0.811927_2_plen_29_part_01